MEKKWFPLAGKSVSPSMNKLPLAGIFLKNCVPPNFNNGFHQQKEAYFLKIGFFLISIMVFTSRNKSCKILFCLGEIVLLIEAIIEIMWRPIFKEQFCRSLWKLLFWLVKNSFFYLLDIPGCENKFCVNFLTNFSFRLMEIVFFYSELLKFFFSKFLKFGGGNFFRRNHFPARGN